MTYSAFITDVYGRVANKATNTLALLRQLTVDQLRECGARRVSFMQGDATFTIPAASPYEGQFADPGVAGFPRDVAEVHQAFYRLGGGEEPKRWEPFAGPVPYENLQSYAVELLLPTPVLVNPFAWSWWEGKFWVTRLAGDAEIRLLYYRDATRDTATGVAISTTASNETNGWFDRGVNYLRWAVLLEYFSAPQFTDERQIGICGAQRALALAQLEKESQVLQPASVQAPMYMGGPIGGY